MLVNLTPEHWTDPSKVSNTWVSGIQMHTVYLLAYETDSFFTILAFHGHFL